MNREFEYWDCECNMSKNNLYKVLYAVILLNGAITDTATMGCQKYTRRQNAYNTVFMRIRLPVDCKDKFEAVAGQLLTEPPKVGI